jgi:uncharacterized protein YbaR (Trm112 family)
MIPSPEDKLKGTPLWDHLSSVLGTLIQQRPRDPSALLEAVSSFVTTSVHTPGQAHSIFQTYPPKIVLSVAKNARDTAQLSEKLLSWISPPAKPKKEDEEGEAEVESAEEAEKRAAVPDFFAQAEMWASVGVGLLPVENIYVAASLKQVAIKFPVMKVRFWGKIFGLDANYYIIEGEQDPERVEDHIEEEQPSEDSHLLSQLAKDLNYFKAKEISKPIPEPIGVGANVFVYYAASSKDPSRWLPLGPLRPEHILASRSVWGFFSGDFDAIVPSVPKFPGRERDFLRAQIARISHATTIVPRNAFFLHGGRQEEQEEGVVSTPFSPIPIPEELPVLLPQEAPDEEDEEAVQQLAVWLRGYDQDELLLPENWVHSAPALSLTQGRATLYRPEEEETDPSALAERVPPLLSPVSRDTPLAGVREQQSPWAVRKAFHLPGATLRVYCARSLRWTGAFTLAVTRPGHQGASTNAIYIGFGMKSPVACPTGPRSIPRLDITEPPLDLGKLQVDGTPSAEAELMRPPTPPPPEPQDEEEPTE